MLIGWLIFLIVLLMALSWAGKRMEGMNEVLAAVEPWEDDEW